MPTGIPMLRVEAEERYYEVEKMLGRDAGSVFPTESKPKGVDIKESLGAVKFVTEKQVLQNSPSSCPSLLCTAYALVLQY